MRSGHGAHGHDRNNTLPPDPEVFLTKEHEHPERQCGQAYPVPDQPSLVEFDQPTQYAGEPRQKHGQMQL